MPLLKFEKTWRCKVVGWLDGEDRGTFEESIIRSYENVYKANLKALLYDLSIFNGSRLFQGFISKWKGLQGL